MFDSIQNRVQGIIRTRAMWEPKRALQIIILAALGFSIASVARGQISPAIGPDSYRSDTKQLGVGLLVLSVYGAVGLWSLKSHALLELLEPSLVVYLLLFFLIAYFVVAALMAAIGAAVSELRDAQALLTPVVLILMLPWLLAAPISSDPDSALSVTLSFLPPLNSFAMLLRVASTNPPPVWQIWLSIAIGFASVVPALWFAAKVFRIGLLLHGKPPSFATLVRWVREA